MSSINTEGKERQVLEAVERLCSAVNSEGGLDAAEAADRQAVSDWRNRLAPSPEEATSSSNCNVSALDCNKS